MITKLLIICPLVFIAGLVDSIAGGGGLIALPAYFLAGLPAHTALATNKISSSFGTTVSTIRFAKNGYIKWKVALLGASTAFLGSSLGAHLALFTSDLIIRHLMLFILPIVAFFVLRNKNLGENNLTNTLSEKVVITITMISAFFIGTYDGFYGPGTGTFLILMFTTIARLDTRSAAGCTKVINLSSNYAALATYIIFGNPDYILGCIAAIFSVAGHFIGSGLVSKNGQKIVRPVILVVLLLLFIKIIVGK